MPKKSKARINEERFGHLPNKERSIREFEDMITEDLMKFIEPVIRKRCRLYASELIKLLKERGEIE